MNNRHPYRPWRPKGKIRFVAKSSVWFEWQFYSRVELRRQERIATQLRRTERRKARRR